MTPGKQLLVAWKKLDLSQHELILSKDQDIREYGESLSSAEFAKTDRIVKPNERFLFNLIPQPFAGKILTAKVYILLLNPGFSNLDLFAEEQSAEFRQALIKNLGGHRSHLWFDPRFHWTGGFQWTVRKFRSLLEAVKVKRKWTMQQTLRFFGEHVAFVELVPYHSARFKLRKKVMNELESVELIRQFVKDELLPRAKEGDCTIIVTRQARNWELAKSPNVIVYEPAEARGAHLSEKTWGGKAILDQLGRIEE